MSAAKAGRDPAPRSGRALRTVLDGICADLDRAQMLVNDALGDLEDELTPRLLTGAPAERERADRALDEAQILIPRVVQMAARGALDQALIDDLRYWARLHCPVGAV